VGRGRNKAIAPYALASIFAAPCSVIERNRFIAPFFKEIVGCFGAKINALVVRGGGAIAGRRGLFVMGEHRIVCVMLAISAPAKF